MPPTTVTVVSPSGFPNTRNCSESWYASSLKHRSQTYRARNLEMRVPCWREDNRKDPKWILGNTLQDRQSERHRLSATRLGSTNAVST